MKNNEARLRIIKDTVTCSLISEVNEKLEKKVINREKRLEIVNFTSLRLRDIMNSLDAKELLPQREIETQQSFEEHIFKVITKVRKILIDETKKEFQNC